MSAGEVVGTVVGLAVLPLTWPVAVVLAVVEWRGRADLDEVLTRPLRRELAEPQPVALDVAS